jgi:hypothetical protein
MFACAVFMAYPLGATLLGIADRDLELFVLGLRMGLRMLPFLLATLAIAAPSAMVIYGLSKAATVGPPNA